MKKQRPPIPELKPDNFLIDSHCHLDMDCYNDDLDAILARASAHGVQAIITIGIDEQSSFDAVRIAQSYSMVKATVGIHPHDVEKIDDTTYNRLIDLASNNKKYVVGYGEIGLDYAKQHAQPVVQKKAFREQLEIAKSLELPIIVHDRDAHDDTLTILREAGPFPNSGVMHCFSGDMHFAEQIIDLGLIISIPGVVTFKNGKELQTVASNIPLQSLILETDGPFLAPDPWRGKRNEPSYLLFTAQKVAALKGLPIEEIANKTSNNVENLFKFNVIKQLS